MPRELCRVCQHLTADELAEIDRLAGNPLLWPSTVWGLFQPPKGSLPPTYRRWGAVNVVRQWLDDHGYADDARFTRGSLASHVRYDVHHIPAGAADLLAIGVIRGSEAARPIVVEGMDPTAVLRFFNLGVQVGNQALELLVMRINAQIEAGTSPDPKLLKALVDLGGKLATTQAGLMQRGLRFGDGDPDDEFRTAGGEAPKVGPHTRIRQLEDGAAPVHDEGRADRQQYNERARQEASEELPF